MINFNIGLVNLGNTCFMNSCLQLLFNCDILNNTLIEKDNRNNNVLLNEYIDLYNLIIKTDKQVVISPKKFLYSLQNESKKQENLLFSEYSQNDIEEFFIFLISNFHEGLKKEVDIVIKGKPEHNQDMLAIKCYNMIKNMYSKEYSEIIDIFFGIHVTQISDTNNKVIRQIPEIYFTLPLSIPDNTNNIRLIDCINNYLDSTLLDGDNQYYYEEKNEKINAYKKIVIWNLPKILVISLKRFDNSLKKKQTLVNFDINSDLNLCKFIKGYNANSYIYELIGTGNHTGNIYGGHYYSHIKKNNEWFLINDTNITKVEKTNTIITNYTYLLFFRKKT